MGFSSVADIQSELNVQNKFRRTNWNKQTPGVVAVPGVWNSLWREAGNPAGSNSVVTAGTNLSLQAGWHDVTPNGGGIQHGGDVSPDTKHILNISAFTAGATGAPTVLMLIDTLAHYPVTSVTSAVSQTCINSTTFTADSATDIITHVAYDIATFSRVTLTNSGGALPSPLVSGTPYWTLRGSGVASSLCNSLADAVAGNVINMTDNGTGTHTITVTLPRYTDGEGVQMFHTLSTGSGAVANFSFGSSGYTNSDGITGRACPTTPALPSLGLYTGATLDATGTGAGKVGPFIPLQHGDKGIRSIQSMQYSANRVSGVCQMVLCKPLLIIPVDAVGLVSERDMLNQIPSMPKIEDGACLHWLSLPSTVIPINTQFYGHIDFVWG